MTEQHALLDKVAGLVDAGKRHHGCRALRHHNAANLKRAHALLETGKARGKIVGFPPRTDMSAELDLQSSDRQAGPFPRRWQSRTVN
jgi:hypothetical protein